MAGSKSSKYEETIIPLLARGSCHLPGNTWCEDWVQYVKNEHIVLGICLHHHLHPLETWERILALVGSIAFGLAATNIACLWDAYDPDASEKVVVVFNEQFYVTQGMLVLWTFGGILHSLFDFTVWHIMACACCHPGGRWGDSSMSNRCRDCGSYTLIPVVLSLVGVATLVVLIRASELEGGDGDEGLDDQIDLSDIEGAHSFSFLSEFGIQLILAWFVYFFAVGTILFSGVLGCGGRLPILGGRPRDKRLVEEQAKLGGEQSYQRWEV